MHFLRKSAVWLASSVLPLLLFFLATSISLTHTAGNPQPIKDTLKNSGVYNSALDGLLKATDNPNENGQGGIRSDNPVVQAAAKKAFSPELIQSSSENFIDGLYAWLEGKTPTVQFKIDLTQAKATFVNEVATGAQVRAASLPACPRGQTAFDDPFAATCLPRGMAPSVAADKIRQELAGGQEKFLKDPVITADSIKSKDGKPAFSSSSKLPENYQRAKKIPVVLSVLVLLALSEIIFLSDSRRKGIKRAGIILLSVGVLLILTALIAKSLVNNHVAPKIKLESDTLQKNVQTLVKDISGTAGKNIMVVGGVYAAIGAAAVGGSIFMARKKGAEAASGTAETPAASTVAAKTTDSAKPKAKKT